MKNHFDLLRITRNNTLNLIKNLSTEQLNFIPKNFNNNIAWNMGHIMVTQQLLFYRLSGIDCYVSDDWINKYRKGTRPEEVIPAEEIADIKQLLIENVQLAELDFQKEKFVSYKEYTTSYNATLKSIEDAIIFNNMHEAMHLGSILALKKLV